MLIGMITSKNKKVIKKTLFICFLCVNPCFRRDDNVLLFYTGGGKPLPYYFLFFVHHEPHVVHDFVLFVVKHLISAKRSLTYYLEPIAYNLFLCFFKNIVRFFNACFFMNYRMKCFCYCNRIRVLPDVPAKVYSYCAFLHSVMNKLQHF